MRLVAADDSPVPPERATVNVWLGVDRVVVCGYSMGRVTWTLDGDVTVVPATAANAELGEAALAMLRERPPRSPDSEAEKPLFKAAMVRSYRQLEREYALVSVDLDGGSLRMDAWKPDGQTQVPLIEFHRLLDLATSSHADIGRLIRQVAQHSVVRDPR